MSATKMQTSKKNLTLSHYRINPNQLNRSLFSLSAIMLKNENKTKKEHLETLPVTINLILLLIMAYCRTRSKLYFVEKRIQFHFFNSLTLFPFSTCRSLSLSLLPSFSLSFISLIHF